MVASAFLIFTRELYAAYLLVFIIGLDYGARSFVGYIYIMEFLTSPQARVQTQVVTALDRLTLALSAIYFRFISKSWIYLHEYSIFVAFIAYFIIMRLPESPKYLVKNGRIQEV